MVRFAGTGRARNNEGEQQRGLTRLAARSQSHRRSQPKRQPFEPAQGALRVYLKPLLLVHRLR